MPTLSDLPGELILQVLKEVIPASSDQPTTLRKYVQDTGQYRFINRRFNVGTQLLAGIHFHAFPGPDLNVLQIWPDPWHPSQTKPTREHRRYWNSFRHPEDYRHSIQAVHALHVERLPVLRSVSLDLVPRRQKTSARIPDIMEPFVLPAAVITLLDRIRTSSHSIEQVHIRIPAEQRCIDAVQTIVATNVNLNTVCIEVDSIRCATTFGRPRPRFRLDHFTFAHLRYSTLQRFVLRAPTCDVRFILSPHEQLPFLRRLHEVVHFGLICNHFSTTLPNWYWVYTLFQHTTQLQACDISFLQNDDHASFKPDFEVRPFALPHLYQLCLDLPEIDSFLLCKMTAPKLYVLRLRSDVHIHLWPDCDINHFPDLFLVQMHCPGPSAVRLDTIGVMHQFFSHNLVGPHNYLHTHNEDFIAYIKPYERVRDRWHPLPYRASTFRQLPPPVYRPTIDIGGPLPINTGPTPNPIGSSPNHSAISSRNSAPTSAATSAANQDTSASHPAGPSTSSAASASAISTIDPVPSFTSSTSPSSACSTDQAATPPTTHVSPTSTIFPTDGGQQDTNLNPAASSPGPSSACTTDQPTTPPTTHASPTGTMLPADGAQQDTNLNPAASSPGPSSACTTDQPATPSASSNPRRLPASHRPPCAGASFPSAKRRRLSST
ncbi:hypothetical protein OC834_006503 [Tilletia horrida]|nr:hypothetical protein OC834_006503 [Tilletia horrida]